MLKWNNSNTAKIKINLRRNEWFFLPHIVNGGITFTFYLWRDCLYLLSMKGLPIPFIYEGIDYTFYLWRDCQYILLIKGLPIPFINEGIAYTLY